MTTHWLATHAPQCCDWRRLNRVTIKDRYPIGSCEGNLLRLGKSKVYSTVDAHGAFHSISVRPTDQAKTSFSTPWGTYQFAKMGFGLCNAPRFTLAANRNSPLKLRVPRCYGLLFLKSTEKGDCWLAPVFSTYARLVAMVLRGIPMTIAVPFLVRTGKDRTGWSGRAA